MQMASRGVTYWLREEVAVRRDEPPLQIPDLRAEMTPTSWVPKIGILAIQGDFAAHAEMLHSLGVGTLEVRTIEDLERCDALVLPGGESTTQLQFLQEEGLFDAIQQFAKDDNPVFGTCAGAILLASNVQHPAQESLGLLDMTVFRNAYGRQLASDVFFGSSKLEPEPMEMVFIRAPIIETVGPGVEVLAEHAGKPVLVQKGNLLAATFHPELTSDSTVHEHFLGIIKKKSLTSEKATAER
jgi:5'-phosphate synthase pdxT subunit